MISKFHSIVRDLKDIDISFFAEDDEIRKGHILAGEYSYGQHPSIAGLIHKNLDKYVIGISINDVVSKHYNFRYLNQFGPIEAGCKIQILTDGIIIWQFSVGLNLPLRQPIYADLKTSYPTWKYSKIQIGYIVSEEGENGFYKIKIGIKQ